jgi:hypothetical protein
MLAPAASGVPSVMVIVLFRAPPNGCAGGVSTVVPKTVTVQGGEPAPEAVQVLASATTAVVLIEVKALKSAIPPGTAIELKSTIRTLRRVTGAPVLFTKRRLTDSVPFAAFGGIGVKLRTRLGGAGEPIVESSRSAAIVLLRRIGLVRF